MGTLNLHKLYTHARFLKPRRGLIILTVDLIKEAILAFYKENGKFPTAASGDAEKYFGFTIRWSTISQSLIIGRNGLPGGSSFAQVKREMGLNILTVDLIKEAILAFSKENGKYPTSASGDAEKYFGFTIRWSAVSRALINGYKGLPGGSTLAQVRKEMGLGVLTVDLIKEAILAFSKENGKYPTSTSGGAEKYFGFPMRWSRVDKALRKGNRGLPGGSSLAQVKREM